MSVMTDSSEKRPLYLNKPWLSPTEAAEYLSISTETLRRRANRGDLKRYGTGQAARYKRSELDHYLHSLN